MKLAYVSPLPSARRPAPTMDNVRVGALPQPSGVSDYSEELLPYLATSWEITLVVNGFVPAHPTLTRWPRLELHELPARAREFDRILYHLGNAPLFARIYNTALRTPGAIVLHDTVLHHLRAWQTLERGNVSAYVDALREAYGETVAEQARRNPFALDRFEYPLSESVIRAARGVIVHSVYARRFVQRCAPDIPVAHVPMGIRPMPRLDKDAARARLNLPQDAFIIAAFGEVQPHKRISVVLGAFAEFRMRRPQAQLVLVGHESPNYDLGAVMNWLGLGQEVRRVGFVPMDEYAAYVAAADVCVNLRYPSAGETSAALLRLLAAGKPVLVTRIAAYAELPEDICIKIEPDAYEQRWLCEAWEWLARRPDLCAALGANAQRYVARHHTLEQAAAGYTDFLMRLGT